MKKLWGRSGAAIAAGLWILSQAAVPAFAAEAGPGAGLAEASGMTIRHTSGEAAAGQTGGESAQTAVPANMTAVELTVSVAEITGQTGVPIQAAPGSADQYGYAYPRTVYRVTGDMGNGWIEIAYDGHAAYLDGNSGEITVKNTWTIPEGDADRAGLIQTAMELLGSRYVSGGMDPAVGFDCSGFVKYVMAAAANVEMPRTSAQQALAGVSRTAEEMRAGDLIAYGSSLGAVGHVGIYIGDGRMIHGDGTGKGVTICVWNDRTDIPRIADVLSAH